MSADLTSKITELVEFNPKRAIKKGTNASFVDMASLPVDSRDISSIVEKEFKGSGSKFKNGDTLFARITPCLENGKTAKVSGLADDEFAHGSTEFIVMSALEPEYDEDYIYYLARLPEFRAYAQARMEGTSGRQRVPWQSLAEFEYNFPEKSQRKRIGLFFKNIDDKIENNRQINQTLEQIAQAIFKSWFVDFEPVKAKIAAREALLKNDPTATAEQIAQAEQQAAIKAISGDVNGFTSVVGDRMSGTTSGDVVQTDQLQTIADLFPNQLVESEVGEIPGGWEVKSFGDVSTCFDSKRVPLSKKKREEKKPGDIPYYGATSVMDYVNEWIFDDIYLLLGEDGSVVKDDGSPFVQYIWGKSWVNNHAHVLQGKAGVSTEQLMLFMKSQNIAAYVTGAVQLKLNQKNMNSIPFFDAGEELNTFFYQVIEPFYSAIRNNSDEIEILSHTRDILLPKLLSGEIELTANQKDLVNA